MSARPCYVTREWAPWTRGGIGVALSGEIERSDQGALVLWDQAPRSIAHSQAKRNQGVSVYSVEELCPRSLPAHVFPSEAYWRSYRVWHALRRLAELERFTTIEFPDFDGLGYVTIKAARLGLDPSSPPLVVRIHGTAEWSARGSGEALLSLEEKQRAGMEQYALRHADRVIAPSQAILEAYRDEYQPMGDLEVIQPRVRLPSGFREGGWVSPGMSFPLVIGFLGKIQPIKGPDVLVRAVCRAMEARPGRPIEVHLMGSDERGRYSPSYTAELTDLIPQDLRHLFHFQGAMAQGDAFDRLARCHAAVFPSRSETFGLAAHELAAMGLPLATTSIPAFRDLDSATNDVAFFSVDAEEELAEILMGWSRALEDGVWPPARSIAPQTAEAARKVSPLSEGASRETVPEDRPNERGQTERDGPRLSVVIPFFEMHDYIEECLDSVEADPWADKEILVVDDGSRSDEARLMLARIRERFGDDPERRVLSQANAGLGNARNSGIRAARGEFVLPLDPDDKIVSGYLGAAVRALDRVTSLAYVVGISSLFQDGEDAERELDWIVPYDPSLGTLFYENGAGTSAAVFRRAHLIRFPYREDLPAYEDWDLHLQLAKAGLSGEALPVVTHRYRQRANGLARLAHRSHDQLLSSMLKPHLDRADPDLRAALEIHLASVARMRGLGASPGLRGAGLIHWVDTFYRRRLKTRMSRLLGEPRRDRIAATVRRWLAGR